MPETHDDHAPSHRDEESRRDEEKLRAFFAEAGEELAAAPPPFRHLWPREKRRQRRTPWTLALAAAGAAAATALALLFLPGLAPEPPALDPEVLAELGGTSWQGPLDFLLATPGSRYLEAAPPLPLAPGSPGAGTGAMAPGKILSLPTYKEPTS